MSVLTEYFAASSDEAAAEVLARPSGPGGGRPGAERADSVVDGGGIEPMLQMLVLESILMGRSEEDIEDDRAGEELVAGDEVDGPSIVKLSGGLMTALRRASAGDLVVAAGAWADAEEFDGATDPDTLAAFLHRLADLARSAAADGRELYCWVSP